ncbi:MAG: hypothetical protein BroJett029_05290 [Alphaproteobacteria bacterium]|nr:MAG: hypothetical protein BroJett029_05290 [Alphaproteobacteria bacterium]
MKERFIQNSSARTVSPGIGHTGRLGLLALATAALVTLSAAIAQGQELDAVGTAGSVYTADERGGSVTSIDLSTGAIEIAPVAIAPHNVQITADGTRLLAVGSPATGGHGHDTGEAAHGGSDSTGRLLILDPENLTSGPVAEITVGQHPAHVVADPQGARAFVTNAGDDTVTVVDLRQREVIGTIGTGDYPHGLRMSPDGRVIYVANVEDGSVSVIDTMQSMEIARIPVGKAPVQVGFTPDGNRVYVSLRDENRVAVIDTAARAVIARIEVGRHPIQVHATPDGRFVYVANQGTETEPADTVSIIEVASGTVVETIRTGRGAHGVTVSADGRLVFVTNIVDATVSAIDTGTRQVVATYSVGAGPNGVTFRPAAADGAEHDAHHPAEAQAAPAPGMPEAESPNGMPSGMPGMMGMMTPEMMEMMQGMMAMRGDGTHRPAMTMCPMMREMMGMASGAGSRMEEGGMGPGALYGMPGAGQEEMTPESVRAWLEQRLAWHGNPRLKIGEIAAAGDATITAEIVTIDGSLVQKLAFNRYPGLVRQMAE